jgi:amidase
MGYKTTGEPWGLTFIARPYQEDALLKMGFAFEKNTKPENYQTTINRLLKIYKQHLLNHF